MGLSTEGIAQMKLQLRRLQEEVPAIATEELRACANEVAEIAKNMAPLDYGDLKGAIQVRNMAQGGGGRFVKGGPRIFDIYINNRHPVSDPEKVKHGVSTVGEYAWYVHEHMGWASQPNQYFMPSQKSVDEGLKHGVEAGGKFLERAGEAMREKTHERLAAVVKKYIDLWT